MRIVIIGGGLIGLLTARELARSGQDVIVVEQGEIGAEASWAGGGILSPLYPWRYPEPVNRLAHWSQRHYPALAKELLQEGGIDPEWTPSGLLMLDQNEHEAAQSWAADYGMPCEVIARKESAELEPGLRCPGPQALWFPGLAQIRNPRLVKSLAKACKRAGVALRASTRVTGVTLRGAAVTRVETETGSLDADRVVIASGAWSARLVSSLGMELPVRPVRGQMILYHGQPGLVRHINLYQGHYLIPRQDGRVLVGSTLEEVEFDKSTTQDARSDLARFATDLFPVLADVPIETQWAGLRPGSPTGIPYICQVPGVDGLYLNTGHFRNGVVLGLASAHLLADMLLERPTILDPSPYRLHIS